MLSTEYLILLIMLLVGLIFHNRKWLSWIIVAYMFLLAFCRADGVGTDVGGYQDDFFIIRNTGSYIRHHFEYGYVWAIIIFKRFSSDYMLFIALSFIPFFWGVLKFIRDSRVNIAFSLFFLYTLAFYFEAYNLMRQMWAIGLIIAAFSFLYNGKYTVFAVITILVAYLFHRSEVMFLFAIPLHYYTTRASFQMNKKLLYILVITSFMVFYISNAFFKDFFVYLAGLLPSAEHYNNYILGEKEEVGNTTSLMYSIFALILIYVKSEKSYAFETYFYVTSICLYNIFNTFSTFGARVFWDFYIVIIILIPQMIFDPDTKYRRLFTCVAIILGLGRFVWSFWLNNVCEVNPYVFRYHFYL